LVGWIELRFPGVLFKKGNHVGLNSDPGFGFAIASPRLLVSQGAERPFIHLQKIDQAQ